MDFYPSERTTRLLAELDDFLEGEVFPAEAVYREQMASADDPDHHPQVLEELKASARGRGLWNLFMTDERWGPGLSVLDYAPLAERTGWSPWLAPEALNCSAPDTGNMEILAMFGTGEQQERWLPPLLAGEIRSCFSMTEPDVASSDPTNLETQIRRDGDEYVITGRKWWVTGAASPRCEISIVMGVTNPDGPRYGRHGMVLVPMDADGLEVRRSLSVFGYHERGGHGEITYDDVRVPAGNLLGEEGGGFTIAQERLGPGRVHHCMRLIGMAERALALMVSRAKARVAFGKPLAEQGVIRDWIAEARIRIEQTRLLVLKAAWLMDTQGNKAARTEIAAIKVVAPRLATWVIDRAIQVFGGAGVSGDVPLAELYAGARALHIADGPDEVHKRTVARHELRRGVVPP